MMDLISRQAAIDAFDLRDDAFLLVAIIKSKIKKLPSVQPEERTEERTETHACDCISRQAAIDAFDLRDDAFLLVAIIKSKIKNLPSAQPAGDKMDDLISRKVAIDAILAVTGNSSVRELYEHVQEHGLSDMWSGGVNAAIDIIIAVPSAQPALDEWCTDCKEYDQERHCCPRWNRVIRTALDDARKELSPVQPEIIMCKDCRWQKDQSGSTAWLPCMALVTPSDFYCGRAERRTDEGKA